MPRRSLGNRQLAKGPFRGRFDDLDVRLQCGYVVLHGTGVEVELPTDFWWGRTSVAGVARLVLGCSAFLCGNVRQQALSREESTHDLRSVCRGDGCFLIRTVAIMGGAE